MKEEKIILFDDPNLVEYRTNLEGWTGPNQLYYGKGEEGERRARLANSTHKKCECGEIVKNNSYCRSCSQTKSLNRYKKFEEIEWDGKSMMCISGENIFFSDMDDVYSYCDQNDIEIEDLQLMHCEQDICISEIDIDQLNEEYSTEDGRSVSDFHPEIAQKVDELNQLIRNTKPILWFESKKRIKITNDTN